MAAHLAGFGPIYLSIVRGEGSAVDKLEDLGRWNAQTVASVDDHDVTTLAARIDALCEEVLDAAGGESSETVVPWHGGLRLPLSTVWAVLAAEFLVHGHDVARAAGKPWPIPADEARAVLMGLLPLLPHFVDPAETADFRARFDLRFRGARDARAILSFDDGRLAIEGPNGGRVDCHISADPAAYLLVGYGRLEPWRPALTGRIVSWGRKPHLAFRLTRLLRSP